MKDGEGGGEKRERRERRKRREGGRGEEGRMKRRYFVLYDQTLARQKIGSFVEGGQSTRLKSWTHCPALPCPAHIQHLFALQMVNCYAWFKHGHIVYSRHNPSISQCKLHPYMT